ncbi:TBC1 domain family member 30 [Chanos chanos]|uniref:TBC1 domain family member 30 n=1 Tax=Chanos chanos TaxID=29144 RepID=A0A6J2WE52_CHACN|nr:TBC1 domain family member 30 [Chanos chanos]
MSTLQIGDIDLKEIDICDGDICSEAESGVFVNSGAFCTNEFSPFRKWAPTGHDDINITVPDTNSESTNGTNTTFSVLSSNCARIPANESDEDDSRALSRASIVDCLLVELYDTYSSNKRNVDSLDSSTEASSSDAFFGRSNTGSSFLQELQEKHTRRHQMNYLAQKDPEELKWIIQEVKYRIGIQSAKLVRQLKRKDRLYNKLQKNCDIITACLQAVSQKRRVDTRLKFTIEPSLGKNGFQQWYDALKAVARLPTGIPKEWRKRVWLTLADQYLHSISIDWEKTLRFAFNDRSNPDDDSLGIQIVKDLHRTGCSSYCGQEAEQDRVVLKRVLLAYARWNKTVGYCQGFNVLAALILEVTEGNEGDALKVMIYLIDKVLPDSYFANNLRALSVDMAVFRDLLRLKLPELSQHLHHLQKKANREGGGSYEPPLTNVFTMQWFLTMFATCLPHHTVLKIWDSVFFQGSEVLLRVALAIWSKLGERIEDCQSADEFYSTMGCLTQEMLEHNLIDSNDLMQTVYSMAPFPFPQLAELREKYTYNITPFPAPVKANSSQSGHGWESDDDGDVDDEDSLITALGCLGPLGGLLAPEMQRYQKHLKEQHGEQSPRCSSMAEVSPGAVGAGRAEHQATINSMMLERMSTDINALKKQYSRIKRRQQQQASLLYIHTGDQAYRPQRHTRIYPSTSFSYISDKCPATSVLASQVHPSPMVNHLLLGRKPRGGHRSSRNSIAHSPGFCTAPLPQGHSTPSTDEAVRTRLHSPWRSHMRAHRRNIARARAQLGFVDSFSLEEEPERRTSETASSQPEEGQITNEEESKEKEEERMKDDGSERQEEVVVEDGQSDLSLQNSSEEEKREEKVEQVEQQLASLELEPGPELSTLTQDEPSPRTEPDPVPEVNPVPPALTTPKCRPGSDSSSSDSGGSLRHTPSSGPPKAQQIFSPFPCVKTPRKSAAARNLGLYGPTSRTPTVHFPQMSRGINRVSSGVSSSTRRR